MNSELLLADLTDQEGFRPVAYDDATGKKVVAGTMVQGNITVAIGWNVAGRPCSLELAQIINRYQTNETWTELCAAAPWVTTAPEPCQRALCNMAFNLGVPSLMAFNTFLSLMQLGHYNEAADDLAGTLWSRQVGSRSGKIQALIKEGIPSG
jgi:lysozyme